MHVVGLVSGEFDKAADTDSTCRKIKECKPEWNAHAARQVSRNPSASGQAFDAYLPAKAPARTSLRLPSHAPVDRPPRWRMPINRSPPQRRSTGPTTSAEPAREQGLLADPANRQVQRPDRQQPDRKIPVAGVRVGDDHTLGTGQLAVKVDAPARKAQQTVRQPGTQSRTRRRDEPRRQFAFRPNSQAPAVR